ncbi:MAG: transcription elongation factor GreA [bacterium]
MTSQIISKEGYDKMKGELEQLIKTKRPEIAMRIQTAKDMGDLSENAEYSEAKDAQAFNEGRIIELESMLKNLTVVENQNKNLIGMGSRVSVTTSTGIDKEFVIVSFNEVDPTAGKISNESPLGQAFLNKVKGDKVVITTPKGKVEYSITNIA